MIIGIDLGTNNVCISYYHNNKLTIIRDNQGNSFIKSLIAINNSIIVTGNDVLNINDKEWIVIRNLKRLIGMSTENIIVHEKEYSIVELTSFLLSKIKKIIDQHLISEKLPPDYEIILTVPAYFNEKQRQSTKDAFTLSGMKLFRIINEPTSACITYYHYNKNFDKNIMVVDIGAGTTDISILTATKDEDGLDIYEVIATSGDNLLGGEDINNILFEYFGWDKTEDNIKKIEDIKIKLSDIDTITTTNDLGISIEKYIELLTPLKDRLLNPIKKVIEISNLKREEIDNVILIGGTSKVPFMKKTIEEFYEKKYTYIINPLTAVSFGAALYGNKLLNNQMILMDIVPLSIGVETVGGQFISIIDRGTTIPTNKIKQFTTEEDNQNEVIIKIYQGESQFIHENFMIGEFVLKDIPKQPRGVPVINVSISIDLNGLINISATDRKNFSRAELLIENKVKLSDEELEIIVSNKLKNDLLYDDYTTMIDNFYLFRNYYNKINYNTNINCVNKMSEEEKLEITNNINETNVYICSIVNLFENKLKLNVQQYCDSFIEIKETDIKRLNEMIKNKNEEIKTKYEILTLTYNNDSNLLNNEVDTQTSIEDNEQKKVTIIERDYESEFYTLMEQIHSNMGDFDIKDDIKLVLIEYISDLIVEENSYENKINNLNNFVDKLLNDTTN